MTGPMVGAMDQAAATLAAALAAETAALEAGDYLAATRLAGGKTEAIEAFLEATRQAGGRGGVAAQPGPAALARLRRDVQANRAALERALAVQGRVIGLLVRAAAPGGGGAGGAAPGYGRAAAAAPVALSVRA